MSKMTEHPLHSLVNEYMDKERQLREQDIDRISPYVYVEYSNQQASAVKIEHDYSIGKDDLFILMELCYVHSCGMTIYRSKTREAIVINITTL